MVTEVQMVRHIHKTSVTPTTNASLSLLVRSSKFKASVCITSLFTAVQSLQTFRRSDFKTPFRGHGRFVDRLSCFDFDAAFLFIRSFALPH